METFWNTSVSLTFCTFARMRTLFFMEVTVHPRGPVKTLLFLLTTPPQRLRGGILPKTVSQSSEDHLSTDLQNKKDAFTVSTHWSVPRKSQWVCFLMQEANFPRQLPEVLLVSCGCAICLWCLFRQITEETWKDLAGSWPASLLTSSPGQHLLAVFIRFPTQRVPATNSLFLEPWQGPPQRQEWADQWHRKCLYLDWHIQAKNWQGCIAEKLPSPHRDRIKTWLKKSKTFTCISSHGSTYL